MRLIDSDDLGIGKANPEAFIKPEYAYGWNAAIEAIKAAPTIDAVPVDKIHFTDLYLDGIEAIAVFKFGNQGITLRKKCEDFAPVVHGQWIHDINNLYGCSECMERETMSPKKLKPYCPNCGAKMDGEADV